MKKIVCKAEIVLTIIPNEGIKLTTDDINHCIITAEQVMNSIGYVDMSDHPDSDDGVVEATVGLRIHMYSIRIHPYIIET